LSLEPQTGSAEKTFLSSCREIMAKWNFCSKLKCLPVICIYPPDEKVSEESLLRVCEKRQPCATTGEQNNNKTTIFLFATPGQENNN
jgi:hypothetical protein